MSIGLLMLLLFWLPAQPTGTPAPANEVFRYVPANASLTIAADVGSLAGSFKRGFIDLGKQSFVRRSRRLSMVYQGVRRRLERGLNTLKRVSGFDPLKDLRWINASVVLRRGRRPEPLFAARGKLTRTLVSRFAAMAGAGQGQRVGNGTLFASRRRRGPSFGWTAGGTALVGSEALVRAALTSRRASSKLGSIVSSQYDGRTYVAAGAMPRSRRARQLFIRNAPPAMRSLMRAFSGAVFTLRYDGLRVAAHSSNQRVARRYLKLLNGLGHYLVAAEHFIRGSFAAADGLLSRRDAALLPRGLRGLALHKRQLLAYLHKTVRLARTPRHRLTIKRNFARLDYNGSLHVGLLPLLGAIGYFTGVRTMGPRPIRPTPSIHPPPRPHP